MANGDASGVWKWLATTLGGALVGVVLASGLMLGRTEAIAEKVREHELAIGHPVMEQRVGSIEADIAEIKRLLEAIDSKIDRLHGGTR